MGHEDNPAVSVNAHTIVMTENQGGVYVTSAIILQVGSDHYTKRHHYQLLRGIPMEKRHTIKQCLDQQNTTGRTCSTLISWQVAVSHWLCNAKGSLP